MNGYLRGKLVTDITSDAVIGFAKQGHPQAVAVLLNRALVPKGAHVKVRQKKELLKILINFLRETDLDQLVGQVQDMLCDLAPQNVERVQIFTQRLGDRQASFQKEIVTPAKLNPSQTQRSSEISTVSESIPSTKRPKFDATKKFDAIENEVASTVKVPSAKASQKVGSAATQERYSVAEYLSQVSSAEELDILEDHPFFTGVCPHCSHGYENLENPPLFWDCAACGWQDDLSQKIPRHLLRETPQRRKIHQGKRLGSYLIEAGLLTPAQIEVALADQQLTGIRLGEVLVRRGWIKEETVEYFMRKVVEPERQASTGQAEAYLESSRNLLKTLIQSKSAPDEAISHAVATNASEPTSHSSSKGSTSDPSSKPVKVNDKETLILSEVDLPSVTAKDSVTAVNERETLLIPDLDLRHLQDE